jgi:hypothetical protein
MTSKLALKRLTASDLTIFKWHFENKPAGNQKAINLNADVFIQKLYPSVPLIIEEKQGTLPVNLYIYGPGVSSEGSIWIARIYYPNRRCHLWCSNLYSAPDPCNP